MGVAQKIIKLLVNWSPLTPAQFAGWGGVALNWLAADVGTVSTTSASDGRQGWQQSTTSDCWLLKTIARAWASSWCRSTRRRRTTKASTALLGHEADDYPQALTHSGPRTNCTSPFCLHSTGPAGPRNNSMPADHRASWYTAMLVLNTTDCWYSVILTTIRSYPIAVAILYCYMALYYSLAIVYCYTVRLYCCQCIPLRRSALIDCRIQVTTICLDLQILEAHAYSWIGSPIGSYSSFHMCALSHRIQCNCGGSPLSE